MDEVVFAPLPFRDAFVAAADGFVDLVARVSDDQWDGPGLGVWSVRDLVGHGSRALATVPTYLRQGEGKPVELAGPFAYFAVLTQGYADHDLIAERGRQAATDLGADPAASVATLRDEAFVAVGNALDDTPVGTPAGVLCLVDYLPSRVFELVTHSADLAAATGLAFVPDRGAALIAFTCIATLAIERGMALDGVLALTGRCPLPDGFSVI